MKKYDPTLFAGTASYYARFRVPYPDALFKKIAEIFCGEGIAFDLGCGTGLLTLKLANYFDKVVGMDPDPEMIQEAKRLAREVENVEFLLGSSWDISPSLGCFRVTTMGESFHWMDREQVLDALYDITVPTGGVVVVSKKESGPPGYQETIDQIITKFLGSRRRAGKGFYDHPKDRHEVILERSKFTPLDPFSYTYSIERDTQGIIGFLYSTSYANVALLGEKKDSFETELHEALMDKFGTDRFRFSVQIEALIGMKNN